MSELDLTKTIGELEEIAKLLTVDEEQVEEIKKVKKDTKNSVEEVIEYSDEEKEKIDELMEKVTELDDMLDSGKIIYGTQTFGLFILGFTQTTSRIKKHFVDLYNDFSIIGAEEKLTQLLAISSNDRVIKPSIKQHINTIIEIKPDYDFGKFNSDALDDIISEL